MATASSFVFDNYQLSDDKQTIRFNYQIKLDDETTIKLTEEIGLPLALDPADAATTRLLEALHIGLGISYYKVFLPSRFEYNSRQLSIHEAEFWNNVYRNGLGEFLYTNQLPPSRLATFSASGRVSPASPRSYQPAALLALGGGKDSAVAGELLKHIGVELTAFVLGTGDHAGQTAAVARDMKLELFDVSRHLDPKLLELNERSDSYNGHVPISMAYALIGLLLCAASNRRYLVVGNESSTSIPNTKWQGLTVNHQWSKSFEFEKLLQKFVHTCVSTDLWYFSAIRPLSSVAVAKLFATHPHYFNDFTSCNRVFVIDPAKRPNGRWCGECAKCLSSFIILAPWLGPDKLVEIFGKNMLDDPDQSKQFLALTGVEGHKPLDCVGTEAEMILSLNLMAGQHKFMATKLMKIAQDHGLIQDKDWDSELSASLKIGSEHSYPPELNDKILATLGEVLA